MRLEDCCITCPADDCDNRCCIDGNWPPPYCEHGHCSEACCDERRAA